MDEFFKKISSYDIFNCLLPGGIFVILTADVIHYPAGQDDVIARLFLYYVVGLVISRVGSLTVEPILKRRVRFAPYRDYVAASEKDKKIDLLSEVNNTYRAMCTTFGLLALVRLYPKVQTGLFSPKGWEGSIGAVLLFILFLLAYAKQTRYIVQRVERLTRDQ